MEEVKFNRQQLYDLVWSEPLSALLKKYCISKADLHKIFQNLNIPLPYETTHKLPFESQPIIFIGGA